MEQENKVDPIQLAQDVVQAISAAETNVLPREPAALTPSPAKGEAPEGLYRYLVDGETITAVTESWKNGCGPWSLVLGHNVGEIYEADHMHRMRVPIEIPKESPAPKSYGICDPADGCGAEFDLPHIDDGSIVYCPTCGGTAITEFGRVKTTEPPTPICSLRSLPVVPEVGGSAKGGPSAETALSILEFHEGSAKPTHEGAQPSISINGEDFAQVLAEVRAMTAELKALRESQGAMRKALEHARTRLMLIEMDDNIPSESTIAIIDAALSSVGVKS